MKNIDEWVAEVGRVNTEKGWDFGEGNIPEKIALMHEELSEALGEFRSHKKPDEIWFNYERLNNNDKPKPEGIAVEFADCVIRIMHFFHTFGLSLDEVLALKMAYNEGRPYRHGDRRA